MDNYLPAHEQLLFRLEVLRAKLDIRDFFLKNTVREVYENIGQVLSLVRMQLAVIDTSSKRNANENFDSPGHLVGQSIRDLRVMCKSFYPDADILNEEGFIEVFSDTLKILYQCADPVIKIKGIQKEIQPGLKLIVFKMIQEMLILINETAGKFISLTIVYLTNAVKFIISYRGAAITFEDSNTDNNTDLTLHERARLIRGELSLVKCKNGSFQIQLYYPLKLPL